MSEDIVINGKINMAVKQEMQSVIDVKGKIWLPNVKYFHV